MTRLYILTELIWYYFIWLLVKCAMVDHSWFKLNIKYTGAQDPCQKYKKMNVTNHHLLPAWQLFRNFPERCSPALFPFLSCFTLLNPLTRSIMWATVKCPCMSRWEGKSNLLKSHNSTPEPYGHHPALDPNLCSSVVPHSTRGGFCFLGTNVSFGPVCASFEQRKWCVHVCMKTLSGVILVCMCQGANE